MHSAAIGGLRTDQALGKAGGTPKCPAATGSRHWAISEVGVYPVALAGRRTSSTVIRPTTANLLPVNAKLCRQAPAQVTVSSFSRALLSGETNRSMFWRSK